jgi:hypothetical protein
VLPARQSTQRVNEGIDGIFPTEDITHVADHAAKAGPPKRSARMASSLPESTFPDDATNKTPISKPIIIEPQSQSLA